MNKQTKSAGSNDIKVDENSINKNILRIENQTVYFCILFVVCVYYFIFVVISFEANNPIIVGIKKHKENNKQSKCTREKSHVVQC